MKFLSIIVFICLVGLKECSARSHCLLTHVQGKDVYFQDENDCGFFYKCDWGRTIRFKCPEGLHWSMKDNHCDWPELANCQHQKDNSFSMCPLVNDYDETIHFPHESDCTLFYKCDWGVAVLQSCPRGLHFNAAWSVCDWPENSNCEVRVLPTPGPPIDEPPENPPNDPDEDELSIGLCPPENDYDETIHLPHEYDCTLFYKCDWGVPVLHPCPDGLHFNPALRVCDYPENAGCETLPAPTLTPPTGAPPTDPPTGAPTDPPTGAPPTDPPGTDEPSIGLCPPENDYDETIHLPHEYDCTLFYKCDWGVPVLHPCPDGLHFNPALRVCDYPENAGCETLPAPTSSPPTGAPPTDPPTGVPPTDPPTGAPPTDPPTGAPPTDVPGLCPPENDYDETIHLPHEYDCTLFYKCDWGVPVLHPCPDGLHFNPALRVCDYPENAGCETLPAPTSSPPTGAPPTDPTTGAPPTDPPTGAPPTDPPTGAPPTDPPTGAPPTNPPTGAPPTDPPGTDEPSIGLCPPENDYDETIHLPHEYDCTLFYKCDWGVPVLHPCPDGLHFNPALRVCDYPENAGCETLPAPTSAPPTGAPPTDPPTGAPPTDPPTGAPPTSPPAPGSCPPINDYDETIHLPHENDCSLFYKCDWGVPVLQHCPPGLHFNTYLSVCDWPETANCST